MNMYQNVRMVLSAIRAAEKFMFALLSLPEYGGLK